MDRGRGLKKGLTACGIKSHPLCKQTRTKTTRAMYVLVLNLKLWHLLHVESNKTRVFSSVFSRETHKSPFFPVSRSGSNIDEAKAEQLHVGWWWRWQHVVVLEEERREEKKELHSCTDFHYTLPQSTSSGFSLFFLPILRDTTRT